LIPKARRADRASNLLTRVGGADGIQDYKRGDE